MIHDQDPIEILAENLFGLGLNIFRDTLLKKKYKKLKIQYKPKQFDGDPIENWEYYKCQKALEMPCGKIMINVAKKIDDTVRDKILQKNEELRMNVVGDLQSSKMSEKKKEYIWKAVDITTKKIDDIFSYTK